MRRPLVPLALLLSAASLAACTTAGPVPSSSSDPSTVPAPSTSSPAPTTPVAATPSPAAPHPVVLGLGDSVTTGWNCGCTDFIRAYAAELPPAANGPGRADNQGQGGLTAAQLADRLSSGTLRANLARADIVIITIGANDLVVRVDQWSAGRCDTACGRAATGSVGVSVGRVLDAVRSQAKASAKIVVTDYWNVFEDGDVARQIHGDAFIDWSDAVTTALNEQIRRQAMAHGDQFVDVYPAFKGDGGDQDPTGLLASDGDHPNAAGEAVITKTLLAATT